MLSTDEDALICDLAQTYGIFEYRDLPVRKVAILACGLPKNARIVMRMTDNRTTYEELMTAMCFDRLNWLCWAKSKDGQKGRNKPESIAQKLMEKPKEITHKVEGFKTSDDFLAWRSKFVEG